MTSPSFESPVFEAEEEEDEEISKEISRLLQQKEEAIQPYNEPLEIINLGSDGNRKEVKVGASLSSEIRESLIQLLKEFSYVFAWSYQDMPGLDTSIVEHHLPLKAERPPVKQKLRTHPEMAMKIKEEVQKQINAGFLVTSEYPQWLANIV